MRLFVLLFSAILLFSGCGSGDKVPIQSSANSKRYPIKGKVISIDKSAKKAKIDHEKIEGFMEAMTMEFPIHADWLWSELVPGADIKGDLVVNVAATEPYWLENLTVSSAPKPGQSPPPVDDNFAQIGNQVPDFTLTNQDGKKVSLRDYRGKALAITFIYARCPLPDYCIKMSTAFSDLAIKLNADESLKNAIRLLSISFDPSNDTPEKLKSYGIGYLGKGAKPDFTVWQLAVGSNEEVRKISDFFGLRYEVDANDKTQINHSLRTAVISPDGRVTKIFPGGEWTPSQLLDELQASLAK